MMLYPKMVINMSDIQFRFNLAAQALSKLLEDNSLGLPIIVEGKKDIAALRKLGFKGTIEQLNRGWDLDRFCTYLYETYGTRDSQGGAAIELLMDWDRTGGRLQKKLVERLQSLDVKISQEARKVLSRALKPETKYVESLSSLGLEEFIQ
jgi:5S rRNA maturation endonuclease (ribonuclease M5)